MVVCGRSLSERRCDLVRAGTIVCFTDFRDITGAAFFTGIVGVGATAGRSNQVSVAVDIHAAGGSATPGQIDNMPALFLAATAAENNQRATDGQRYVLNSRVGTIFIRRRQLDAGRGPLSGPV